MFINSQCSVTRFSANSLLLIKQSRQTKVCDFWYHIVIEQYVRGFKVHVNYGFIVLFVKVA
jgi:hypothetical protein